MKSIIAYYNELEYRIEDMEGKELYSAGNSPFDSQQYVPAEEGVGLETMKQYAEQTGNEIAKEQGLKFVGSQYRPYEEPEPFN